MGEIIYMYIYVSFYITYQLGVDICLFSIDWSKLSDVYVCFELVFKRCCPSLIELVFISIKGCCLYHSVASILNDDMMNITLPYNHCVIFRTLQTLTNCSMCLDLNYRNSHKIKFCSI